MAHNTTRLPSNILGFNTAINLTSDYLLRTTGTPPVTNGVRLGWTQDEITFWTDQRGQWVPLMVLYANKKGTRTISIRAQLISIIKAVRGFEKLHKLYDRIASSPDSTIDDYEVFNIKRGTELADAVKSAATEPGSKGVIIGIKLGGHLYHELLIKSPDTKGRAKEAGVKEILVFVMITDANEAAPAVETYQYIGNVKRGIIMANHISDNIGRMAWYTACVVNSTGEKGPYCAPLGFIIT